MPKGRKTDHMVNTEHASVALPEGIEFVQEIIDEKGDWALVKIRMGDLSRVKLMELPKEVRDYFRETQKEYRQRLKVKGRPRMLKTRGGRS